jgi:iron complex outermembrane receptor protein
VPVTGVKPEYVNDFEVGVRYRTSAIEVMVNAYRENFTNIFINSFNTTSGLTSVSNGGTSRYQGAEFEIVAPLALGDGGRLDGHVTYSHNQATFLAAFTTYSGVAVAAGQPLADVPRDLATMGLDWHWSGWRASIQARYVGLQYIDQLSAGTPTASTIAPHTLADLGISKSFDLDGSMLHSVRLALNVDNLFNKYYLNEAYTDVDYSGNNFVRGVPGAPRSILGTVGVKF